MGRRKRRRQKEQFIPEHLHGRKRLNIQGIGPVLLLYKPEKVLFVHGEHSIPLEMFAENRDSRVWKFLHPMVLVVTNLSPNLHDCGRVLFARVARNGDNGILHHKLFIWTPLTQALRKCDKQFCVRVPHNFTEALCYSDDELLVPSHFSEKHPSKKGWIVNRRNVVRIIHASMGIKEEISPLQFWAYISKSGKPCFSDQMDWENCSRGIHLIFVDPLTKVVSKIVNQATFREVMEIYNLKLGEPLPSSLYHHMPQGV